MVGFCFSNLSICDKSTGKVIPLQLYFSVVSHWGGPDPVDEEEKDYLAKNMSIYNECTLNVDLHSQALLSNKCLTKSTQLNIAIGY